MISTVTNYNVKTDPYIDIDMVGVPLKIAKELTIPEEVTPQNIKHLSQLVVNGRTTYPGANYIFRTTIINGKTISYIIDKDTGARIDGSKMEYKDYYFLNKY